MKHLRTEDDLMRDVIFKMFTKLTGQSIVFGNDNCLWNRLLKGGKNKTQNNVGGVLEAR